MKAAIYHEFGPPDVLQYEDIATPEVGPDDVLVKVHAVSVNRTLDLEVRANNYARTPPLPHILGVDPSGVIEAVGANVTDRKVGEGRIKFWVTQENETTEVSGCREHRNKLRSRMTPVKRPTDRHPRIQLRSQKAQGGDRCRLCPRTLPLLDCVGTTARVYRVQVPTLHDE